MKAYRDCRPTQFDTAGLALEDKQDWLVSIGQNRDSGCLARSNFRVAEKSFAAIDPEGNDHEVHRFGHWACGWLELIIVRPDSPCAKEAEEIEAALAHYPVLNDMDHSELESEEVNEVWQSCYTTQQRIDYIRKHRSQFEFRDLADMLGCVRGHYFAGYASELLY